MQKKNKGFLLVVTLLILPIMVFAEDYRRIVGTWFYEGPNNKKGVLKIMENGEYQKEISPGYSIVGDLQSPPNGGGRRLIINMYRNDAGENVLTKCQVAVTFIKGGLGGGGNQFHMQTLKTKGQNPKACNWDIRATAIQDSSAPGVH